MKVKGIDGTEYEATVNDRGRIWCDDDGEGSPVAWGWDGQMGRHSAAMEMSQRVPLTQESLKVMAAGLTAEMREKLLSDAMAALESQQRLIDLFSGAAKALEGPK